MSRADKPLPSLSYLQPRIRVSRAIAGLAYVGLLACLFVYNAFFRDLHGANPLVIGVFMLIPLLIFLPGIISGNPRVHAWLCFAINLYFAYGVLACLQPERQLYGAVLVGTSVTYFIAALGYVRWSFQAMRVRSNATTA
ncbi:hypothetical protein BN1049_00717 [Pseudomonas saudimassiliensis]|uniref:DUF2069 domain-containing protein n=1 Tax=Pseudomonas saudimassiliensis TaxID=1461581 RepID=A0A078MA72_9PSED|nr:DUF2069 domain-containing protein [Pseudomonas saudimassiliensis]CEA02317.1 hypothetical protein BN1049_00717 [Pseudomonas saudimassiliensis]CEF25800.1 hypothetical protein BN1049_00717 [Pseudomonas saudimassiliensis]